VLRDLQLRGANAQDMELIAARANKTSIFAGIRQ
jgi:hypothetical protein